MFLLNLYLENLGEDSNMSGNEKCQLAGTLCVCAYLGVHEILQKCTSSHIHLLFLFKKNYSKNAPKSLLLK